MSILRKCVAKKTVLANAAQKGLLKLEKYELDINEAILPFIAVILHPGLKCEYFVEHKYPNSTIRDIKRKVSEYFTEHYKAVVDEESSDSDEDELMAYMFKKSKSDKISSELDKYLKLPRLDRKLCPTPLEYWKGQKVMFPLLSKMAMDIFAVQPSSVAVERDFSGAGRVVPTSRPSLEHETITATMCVKFWLK